MAMKVEIISKETVKPSSPIPDNAKDFKICMLDELAPPSYVPILLFYPSPADFTSDKLKKSLSETLSRFRPLAGKLKGYISFDCSDEGVLFVEAKVNIAASEIINNPQTEMLHQLFPLYPYNPIEEIETAITAVQVNVFACSSVGIGVCVSHKVADAASLSYFLQAWAATTTGSDTTLSPRLDSALLFPPRGLNLIKPSDLIRNDKVVTRRFMFDRKNLVNQVNFRERMKPQLPGNSLGNLCRLAVAAYLEKLQGVDGLAKAIEPLRELRQLASGGEEAEVFTFSSWTRFPLYEIDFGWGKPIRACTLTVPIRDCVVFMPTSTGDGIEAWITLTENDMPKFESSEELLQFVSTST